jgi:hypothetical protein
LLFSELPDQQPPDESPDTADPVDVHGPPIPSAGVVAPGTEIIGTDEAGAMVIEGDMPVPATRGIG